MRKASERVLVLISSILLLMPLDTTQTVECEPQARPQIDPAATPAFVPPSAGGLRASPRVIQPIGGKLPASMTVAVLANCDDSKALDMTTDHLAITGGGLSMSPPTQQFPSKCVIHATLTIDPNTPPGDYTILVEDAKGTPVGSTEISVLDSSAGGIPPGLAPQVDVIWGVMSQNDCSDVFGKRVSKSMYCVQLKIGNNSGHPLQIAGIGFTKDIKALAALGVPEVTIANTSYAATRAVLVESQVWSTRNLAFNVVAGAGLIMAASSPFFSGTSKSAPAAKTRFLSLSTIVNGPLQQAFNLVFPDPIVSQLKSLDDQSFRDNMVIPNNSQVQTVVFVEKQNLTTALAAVGAEIDSEITANNSQMNVVQTDTKQTAQEKSAATESAQMKATLLQTVMNESKKTSTNSTRPAFSRSNANPLLVKVALGTIVIVGNEIQFLQRVQIQNSATAAGSIAVTVSPATQDVPVKGTQQFTATVANDQNGAGVNWAFSDANCTSACGTLNTSTATGTNVTYTAPDKVPGPNTVTIRATSKVDGTKSGTAVITVTPPKITVAITPSDPQTVTRPTPISFSATVQNDPASGGVNWTVTGDGCTGDACGKVTPSAADGTKGSYAPPANLPSPNAVKLTATSKSDAKQSASVTITIK
jgi:hypothetical protein